ncbi:hemolysin family protein [Streptomyces sp. TRM 70351]|uniref:hemolysin family protein n=1 Tax=Streptomyces sp. TRM 70351 TaxID=3116552 RepID=UPI002E7BD779|nr:hemolysin family protein [Streptomyces sp. TRM 70351]MEE1930729.1 hemolysin family protein [Streptomyces sp. TRM 70351]
MTVLQLVIGVLMISCNALFVGAEFSLISVRRSQIEPRAEQGDRRAVRVLWALEHLAQLMATAQLGITLTTLIMGIVAEPAVEHLLAPVLLAVGVSGALAHTVSFVLALAFFTYLHMLFGEMVPKNIALAEPERTALLLGPPLAALTRGLRPVIFSVNSLANALLRLLRVEPRSEVESTFSDDELARIVADSSEAGLLEERATARLRDALELGRRPVAEVVRPTARVVSAPAGVTPDGLERLCAVSGYSRFPVVDGGGKALGYLHVKDALDAAVRDAPFPASALRPIARVRAQTPLDDVLGAMRGSGTHLAAVIGGDGRAAGLVTMEDVLRELVGRTPPESGAPPDASPGSGGPNSR